MQPLKYEYYIGAQPAAVWRLFVSPEGTKQIFSGSVVESTFQVGQRLAYVGPGQRGERTVHLYGTVLEYEPDKHLSFTHIAGQAPAGNEMESRITISVEPVGQCTKLTLVHDNWIAGDPAYDQSIIAWPLILSNVKTLAETGKTLELV